MRCETVREGLSAVLDGEEPERGRAELTDHLDGCAGCQAWLVSWQDANRRIRVSAAADVPDLSARIVAAAMAQPAARPKMLASRASLVLVGLAQLAFAIPLLLHGHDHEAPRHVAHELGSFDVAVTVGFLAAAFWPTLAAGALPVAAAAVALLGTTAWADLASGRTELHDEAPHLLTVLGLVLLVEIVVSGRRPSHRAHTWRAMPVLTRLHLPRRRLLRWSLTLGAVVLAAVAAATPADAHATLQGSDPGQGGVVQVAPAQVTLHFDEAVTTIPGSLRVLDPNGHRADTGRARHPDGHAKYLAVSLRAGLPHGTYLVDWRVVSADSHPVHGAFTFSIGTASAAPSASGSTESRSVGIGLGVARWATYLGLAVLLGGALFRFLCWPAGADPRRLRLLLWSGWGLLGLGTSLALGLKGAYDAGSGLGSFADPTLTREVMHTTYGQALVARLVLLAVTAAWLAVMLRHRARPGRSTGLPAGGLLLALGLLLTVALGGHAAAGTQRPLALGSELVHLAAMSAWLGGLAVLALVLLVRARPDELAAAVPRFSRVAAVSVALLVATGCYQAGREVGGWAALTSTHYGALLLIKLNVVVFVLVAAAVSRAWVARHFPAQVVHATVDTEVAATEEQRRASATATLRTLRRSVATEAALAVVVLAITAVLVVTQPARSAYHPSVDESLHLGPVTAQVSAVPVGDRQMDLHLYTYDAAGAPTDPAETTARLTLPSQGLGPLVLPLTKGGPGHELAHVVVPVVGDWQVEVSVRTDDVNVYSGLVRLPVR